MIKRLLDIVVSALGLLVLSPLLLVIAVAIVIGSGWPVLFQQQRVGRNGNLFEIYKFRSMSQSAQGVGPSVTSAGDPRVTSVGRWLRSSKLDELPQLWNVLRGDLSLVGPRPEVPSYVALWLPEDREVILSVRPGITDPASTKYRREEELLATQPDPEEYYRQVILPDKIRMYREYVNRTSMATDLRVLADTAHSVVSR